LLQSQIEASEKEGGEGGEREANRVLTWSPWRPGVEPRRRVDGGAGEVLDEMARRVAEARRRPE